jgi:DNA-binding response OmpR family regulator
MTTVLVVEDAPDFQAMIQRTLSQSGYAVTCVATAAEAFTELENQNYDLVLLDIVLPDGDGYRVCTRMQKDDRLRNIPIFFLTGRTDVYDKVMAFSLGADDYIVKPFDPVELRARIEARLAKRRVQRDVEDCIRKGDLTINLASQKATVAQKEGREVDLRLTPAEFKLLNFLARHEGKLCSRAQLLTAVWGRDVHVLDHNVYTHICALRRKLSSKTAFIESVPRLGYRFVVSPLRSREV